MVMLLLVWAVIGIVVDVLVTLYRTWCHHMNGILYCDDSDIEGVFLVVCLVGWPIVLCFFAAFMVRDAALSAVRSAVERARRGFLGVADGEKEEE